MVPFLLGCAAGSCLTAGLVALLVWKLWQAFHEQPRIPQAPGPTTGSPTLAKRTGPGPFVKPANPPTCDLPRKEAALSDDPLA